MTQEAHTPEPWHVDEIGCYNDYRLRLCEPMRNGFPLATIAQFEFNWRNAGQYDRRISYREAEGNARRAAACVNALAGIPIEAIESGVVAELVAVVRDTRLFNEGVGFYNFSRLPDDERANASYDAWQQIAERMDAILAKLGASK